MTEVTATPTQREQLILTSDYVNVKTLIVIHPFCHIMHGTNRVKREKLFNETSGIPILNRPELVGAETGNSKN